MADCRQNALGQLGTKARRAGDFAASFAINASAEPELSQARGP